MAYPRIYPLRVMVPKGHGLNGVERAIVQWTFAEAAASHHWFLSTMPTHRNTPVSESRCSYCLSNPDGCFLVDVAAIAERLSVPKDTVHKWRHRGLLPEPDYPLAVGPVWEWSTIEKWARATNRLK